MKRGVRERKLFAGNRADVSQAAGWLRACQFDGSCRLVVRDVPSGVACFQAEVEASGYVAFDAPGVAAGVLQAGGDR